MKEFNFPKVKRVRKRTLAQDLISMKPNEMGRELGKLYRWIHDELGRKEKKDKLLKAIKSKRKFRRYIISEINKTIKKKQKDDRRIK